MTTLQLNLSKEQSRVVLTSVVCVAVKNICLMTRHIPCSTSGVLPQQLQTLAISGRFGKQAGVLRPLDLKVKELRMELEARAN